MTVASFAKGLTFFVWVLKADAASYIKAILFNIICDDDLGCTSLDATYRFMSTKSDS